MNAIPPSPFASPGDFGTSFESALGSVGAPTTNPLAGMVPPPVVADVLTLVSLEASQQTVVQLNCALSAYQDELQSLEFMLLTQGATLPMETLNATRGRIQVIKDSVPRIVERRDEVMLQVTAPNITGVFYGTGLP